MKKYVCRLTAALNLIFVLNIMAYASSAFMAKKGNNVLTGRNGDSKNLNAIMHVLPPSDGKYGRIYLGAEDKGGFYYTTGMNEHGLWYGSTGLYDGAALPERHDIKNYYNKPTWPYELAVKVMEECATVDEAIDIYSTYFTPYWNGHTMFVDKNGNSVIVEFGENDVVFVRRKNNYQVMTNFPNSDTLNARWYNCYRYNTAESILASSDEISTDLFQSICNAVHQEGSSPTSLSTVYDLMNDNLFVYYFHNYKEFLKFNIHEELQKGKRYYRLAEYYNQMTLTYPIQGEDVNSSSVTFIWNGNADHYQLFYSNDRNFTDGESINISASHSSRECSLTLSACWFGVWLFGALWVRKKKARAFIIGLIISTLFLSCGIDIVDPPVESPFTPSTIEHHRTIEHLQPNAIYYWKIVAIGAGGINSESIVETFKTKD
jgi:hypothetical protein